MLRALAFTALAATGSPALAGEDPHRQFDFWLGEWSVLNRHLAPDGSWVDGDVTRARITPACGGRAVVEEWVGPFRGAVMNGFSLRAFDPTTERWSLVLFWTTDGDATFGRLAGRFRHGRGEFFAGGGGARTRYTFSDALPETVRWDSATTADGGVTWKTDWIMEFTRTRAASEATLDELFATDWTEGSLSEHAEARELDWMLGSWRGVMRTPAGEEHEARLRCKLLSEDCLVLDVLETRPSSEGDWTARLCVRGWIAPRASWEAWRVEQHDPRLVPFGGRTAERGLVFEHASADGASRTELLVRLGEDCMQIEEVRRSTAEDGGEAADAEPELTTITLDRVRD